jgi:hypothetical protein
MEIGKCPKCNGTGIVRERDGSVHTCFDCLMKGKLDQQEKNLPNDKPVLRKLNPQSQHKPNFDRNTIQ